MGSTFKKCHTDFVMCFVYELNFKVAVQCSLEDGEKEFKQTEKKKKKFKYTLVWICVSDRI